MSRENVEIVRQILDAWERGDFRSQARKFDPDIAFETFMPDADENVKLRGLEALEGFTRDWLAQWRDYRIAVEDLREVGTDKVFASARQTATGEHSGAMVESPGFIVWTVESGMVIGLSLHYDRAAALRAAGLSE
jgi:ketosteroid isomerase-like protein